MKIYIDTLGCAKNEYDSQMLAASLEERGCSITFDADEADVLIVNTCGFIDDAKRESIERIFELSDGYGGQKRLIVTGCLSERYHDELAREMPEVDMFFGVNDYDKIPDILMENFAACGNDYDTDTDGRISSQNSLPARRPTSNFAACGSDYVGSELDMLPYRRRDFRGAAHYGYLKIAEGCNNACSFCAIPLIRGSYRSKRMEDCVREAEDMAAAGIRELILIAQDTSLYGADLYGALKLPVLLRRLCAVEGIEWIRLMYVYDNNITDELMDVIAEEPKICKYIDMPIQHVSDDVLSAMKRRSSGASIRAVINKLRERIPDVHIRTTLLLGFPGETEDDIRELLGFIDTADIDRLGAFAFSDEEGTPSHDLDNKVGDDIAAKRRDAVMQHQLAVSERLNEKKIGGVYEVIIDEVVEEGIYAGRTRYDAPEIDCCVTFSAGDTDLVPGDIVNVRITDAFEYDLEGEAI